MTGSPRIGKVTTRTGDDGSTGLLGPDRVPKYHPRIEACGELDEATSALGLARATVKDPVVKEIILGSQRDLYAVMSEVVATPETALKLPRRIGPDDVRRLEEVQAQLQAQIAVPREFVVPGDSLEGAALDLARAIVRRGERRVAWLLHDQSVANPDLLRYVNRLSDLLFVLARYVEGRDGVGRPTLAQT